MIPRIETIAEKKLVGKHLTMTLSDYKIADLWKSFMPKRFEISNKLSDVLISMAIYEPTYFADFCSDNKFDKWAAIEVAHFDNLPNGMETFVLRSGLYAVVDYKGLNTDYSVFQYIFNVWLPRSEYVLDNRPHFELLGEKYKNNDPTSEEEIWIPIKQKF